ncbi:cytochrome P450 [Daedalea quercina L-15889]|uniref:Cytochrome P450 n=1 Tax=Daedalea quercina L-15889 TaxID=1314783 RepID=A0A165R3J0_9APHY|nr:cytochrome P450 [Daedalea quercina L-15889]
MDATKTFNSAEFVTPLSISRSLLSTSISTLLFFALSFAVLYFVAHAVYQSFFSPLAALPGPWYSAISDFWLTTHVVRFQQCRIVQALFDKYGPVVRVGPNKVAFCNATTMRSVYCVHKFDKSSYYKSLLTNNNDHAMTTLPHAEHAVRRKAYSSHYIPSNLALFQTDLQDLCLKLVDTLGRTFGSTPVDCLDLFRHLMVDIIGTTVFGRLPGSLDNWAKNIQDPLATAVYDFPKRGVMRSAVPTWAWNLVCLIPNNRLRQVCDSDRIMAQFVAGRLYEMRTNLQAGPVGGGTDTEKLPLLQRMLLHRVFATNECMPDKDIISEGMGHLVAGVDTSSTTLSYLLWELSRRADIAKRLQAELDEAMPDRAVIPDAVALTKLPYLNAFIKEGLRLYGAAPSLLERVVSSTSPSGLDDSFDLMGYAVPPGTIVSTQAWSMHRDASVFPSPETFLPERWLAVDGVDGEDERLAMMNQHMVPFGVGSRLCGGHALAQLVMRMVIAVVARNLNITADVTQTNERSMEMRDAFVLFPAAKECKLIFNARKN